MDILDDLPWGEGPRLDKAGQESICLLVEDERDDLANLPKITIEEARVILGLVK